jgi:hypothetical protein
MPLPPSSLLSIPVTVLLHSNSYQMYKYIKHLLFWHMFARTLMLSWNTEHINRCASFDFWQVWWYWYWCVLMCTSWKKALCVHRLFVPGERGKSQWATWCSTAW